MKKAYLVNGIAFEDKDFAVIVSNGATVSEIEVNSNVELVKTSIIKDCIDNQNKRVSINLVVIENRFLQDDHFHTNSVYALGFSQVDNEFKLDAIIDEHSVNDTEYSVKHLSASFRDYWENIAYESFDMIDTEQDAYDEYMEMKVNDAKENR